MAAIVSGDMIAALLGSSGPFEKAVQVDRRSLLEVHLSGRVRRKDCRLAAIGIGAFGEELLFLLPPAQHLRGLLPIQELLGRRRLVSGVDGFDEARFVDA